LYLGGSGVGPRDVGARSRGFRRAQRPLKAAAARPLGSEFRGYEVRLARISGAGEDP
jgi:hypothetical protein